MAGILPKGENIRNAIKWISGMLQEDADRSLGELIQKASVQYNLSPKEEAFLSEFYRDA